MHTLNRLIAIGLGLVIMVVAGAVLLIALGVASPEQVLPSAWASRLRTPTSEAESTGWGWTIGGALLGLVAGAALLALEWRSWRRGPAWLTVTDDGLGRVRIATPAVQALVRREAIRIDGVTRVRSWVDQDTTRELRIRCRVAVAPSASMAEVGEAVQNRVKAAVEHHVGRPVAEVVVETATAGPQAARRARRVR